MKRSYDAFTQRNTMPKVERNVREATLTYDRKTWWIDKLRDAHLAREVAIAALNSCGVEDPLKLLERIPNE